MDFSYFLTPFVAWLTAGAIKFLVNSIKFQGRAIGLIGYGGFPSNHSAIVSSMVTLIALKEGLGHPAFGAALTLAFIVMLDAGSLRRQIGAHAEVINKLAKSDGEFGGLRERMGHSRVEILAGVCVGVAVALLINAL